MQFCKPQRNKTTFPTESSYPLHSRTIISLEFYVVFITFSSPLKAKVLNTIGPKMVSRFPKINMLRFIIAGILWIHIFAFEIKFFIMRLAQTHTFIKRIGADCIHSLLSWQKETIFQYHPATSQPRF